MANFDNIIQEINTNLPDNISQSITAAKLRTTLIDLTNQIDTVQDDFETQIGEEINDLGESINNISLVAVATNLSDDSDTYTDYAIIKPIVGIRFSTNPDAVLDKSYGYTNKFYTDRVTLLDTTNYNYSIFNYDNGNPTSISNVDKLHLIRVIVSRKDGSDITSSEIISSFTFNSDFTKDVIDKIKLNAKYSNKISFISETSIVNGVYKYLANRVCTTPIPNVDKINIASGYEFGYVIVNDDGTIGSSSTSWSSSEVIFNNKTVIVNVRKSNSSSITKAEAESALMVYFSTSDYINKKNVTINSKKYFERGGFSTTGVFTYLTTRVRTISPAYTNKVIVNVNPGSNYVYNVYAFDSQGTMIFYESSWQNTSKTYFINGTSYYYFAIANSSTSTNITLDEVDTSGITFNYLTETPPDEKYVGKRISVLGDSISTFGTPDQNNSLGMWCYPGNLCRYPQNNLFTSVKDQYWHKLMAKYTIQYGVNDSIRGSLVSWDGTTETTVIGADKHLASLTRINHLGLNGTPDYILVYGGTNDAGNNVPIGTFNTENPMNYTEAQIAALPVDTFANAYRTMLIRLQYYYPTSKILLLLPNYITRQTYYTVDNLDEYVDMIKVIADYFGVKYVDLRTSGITIFNASTYLPDEIHPNATGMNLLFENVDNVFKTL